jgi:hypothetical protein
MSLIVIRNPPPELYSDNLHLEVLKNLTLEQFAALTNIGACSAKVVHQLENEFVEASFSVVKRAQTLASTPFRLEAWPALSNSTDRPENETPMCNMSQSMNEVMQNAYKRLYTVLKNKLKLLHL